MGIMEGRDRRHIQEKFSDLYAPLIKANWQIWPLAQVSTCPLPVLPTTALTNPLLTQLINFRFMPLPYRVPFQSTCGVFWTLYLSLANSKYV